MTTPGPLPTELSPDSSQSHSAGGYFVRIFQVVIWGDGADRLCLRRRAWCEALLAGLEASVLLREGEPWKDEEGLLK